MIKPIQNISFKGVIRNKDIISVINKNEQIKAKVYEAKLNATYQFINGKLEMVKSDNTDEYLKIKKDYVDWLDEEVGKKNEDNI